MTFGLDAGDDRQGATHANRERIRATTGGAYRACLRRVCCSRSCVRWQWNAVQPELGERIDHRRLRRFTVRHDSYRHGRVRSDACLHRRDQWRPEDRPRPARRRHSLGKQYCTEAYDQSIYELWTQFKDPLVYTPGDNEWTDCNKLAEGGGAYNQTTQQIDHVLDSNGNPVDYAGGDPNANLDLVRSIFFSSPGYTLGGRKKRVLSQASEFDPSHPSDAKSVENVMWEQSNVLFVTINLPGGSNNDMDVWYGAPTETAAQTQERNERTGADLRWLDAAFARALAEGAEAVVIGAQADMWDPEKGAAHQAGYEPFVQSIASLTTDFGRPVLMFNGDSHVYQSGNPLSPSDPNYAIHRTTTWRTSIALWFTAARSRSNGCG
jgi:hypothetical protein